MVKRDDLEGVYNGMALGFDTFMVEALIALGRADLLHLALPSDNQDAKWLLQSRQRYHKLIGIVENAGGKVTIVSKGAFEVKKLFIRNNWMIDRSQVVIGCWDGMWTLGGGTYEALRYAHSLKRRIYWINPLNRNARWMNDPDELRKLAIEHRGHDYSAVTTL